MNKNNSLALNLLQEQSQNICVRKAGIYHFPTTYFFKSHCHIEYEINYVNSGCAVMLFEKEQVPLKKGDCISIFPNYKHEFLVDFKSGCKLTQVEVKVNTLLISDSQFLKQTEHTPYQIIKNCEDILPIMEQIARLNRKEKNNYTSTMLDLSVVQLIITFDYHTQLMSKTNNFPLNKKLDYILKYIHDHYTDEIHLEVLAQQLGVSSRYIRQCFSDTIGMSCMDYISTLRINRAKELLWESDKDITTIALECGYGSVQYFSRKFKEVVSMSPSQFRKKW